MIPSLVSPSVCVIDDDERDYKPILDALHHLGLGCVHVEGDSAASLRGQPMAGLRVVFTDLHLSGHVGKAAASHTANVFKKVVSATTAPVVVVIWSKYADDRVLVGDGVPPDDQPTEADMFRQTLLESEPAFEDRLVFCEMKKPKFGVNRPEGSKWVTKLKKDIQTVIEKHRAFEVLWTWESIVREAGVKLTQSLTMLAVRPSGAQQKGTGLARSLHDRLELALMALVREQGGPDPDALSAPRHLVTVLAQTLADQIEHSSDIKALAKHGEWLIAKDETTTVMDLAPGVNGLLMTAAACDSSPFVPGTVYRLVKAECFERLFGVTAKEFIGSCVDKKADAVLAEPILLEISPACDVDQKARHRALLIAGVMLPSSAFKNAKNNGAFERLKVFKLRWPAGQFVEQDVALVFCRSNKTMMDSKKEPRWLIPWFRLRELPTASLRNSHAAHASRVGYVSL